jgi:glycerol kinase
MFSFDSTGIPLSTYFSAIKLRWMIDHHPEVHEAHEADDLMFGTVDTWLVFVRHSDFLLRDSLCLVPHWR